MPLSAADLAGMRATINDFLDADTITNARTGAVLPCRIRSGARDLRPFPHMRNYLMRWFSIITQDAQDIVEGDRLTSTAQGPFIVTSAGPEDYSVSTKVTAIKAGATVAASTLRQPSSLAVGGTGVYATHIASLTLYQWFSALLQPVSPQFMDDTFHVQTAQAAVVYALAPPSSEAYPIAPKDVLVVGSARYTVHGIVPWIPGFIGIYVDAPTA